MYVCINVSILQNVQRLLMHLLAPIIKLQQCTVRLLGIKAKTLGYHPTIFELFLF